MKPENNKRKRPRTEISGDLKIRFPDGKGVIQYAPATLIDLHEYGCGVEIEVALQAGLPVTVVGVRLNGQSGANGKRDTAIPAKVAWCLQRSMGRYRAGIAFMDAVEWPPESARAAGVEQVPDQVDYYEMLQLSPNADVDTVHRVYRLLAQRYHPDNTESGNDGKFRVILDAYKILSDPEKRAAYDAGHERSRRHRWKVFAQARAMQGMESERVKRQGILALLYTKRVNYPDQPGMTVIEIEDMLGIPREHLEFSIWYLRESGCIQRTDNGRYFILARGVDEAEKPNRWWQRQEQPLLEEGRRPEGGAAPAA